ncbi:hypothetical protein PJ267_16355 [Arthrobacter sp. OVS8]|nr:hypothetical protein PJ267_16355 [Arthrobacter sp. OVS8]
MDPGFVSAEEFGAFLDGAEVLGEGLFDIGDGVPKQALQWAGKFLPDVQKRLPAVGRECECAHALEQGKGMPPIQVITSPGICRTRKRKVRFPPVRVRTLIVPPWRSSPSM